MAWYIIWMLLASSLGIIKLFTLALLLSAPDYGHYVAIFGLSTLAGAILSFGSVERTIKLYPRFWVEGRNSEILADARSVLQKLFIRFISLGTAGFFITYLDALPFNWIEVVYLCLLGFASACLALFASLFRATSLRRALQNYSLWRSALACLLALAAGWSMGWIGALTGDILAASITIVSAIFTLRRLYSKPVETLRRDRDINEKQAVENGHGSLYIANMLTSSTSMADRALVGAILGASSAGSYGFIMLIPQVFVMLVNIVSQYIGPLIIKFTHLHHQDESRISAIGMQGAILAALAVLCVIAALAGQHLPFINQLFEKFTISDAALIFAGVIAAGQIYGLIEFHLIALDGEHFILSASMLATALLITLLVVGAIQHILSVEYFIGAAAAARWFQVGVLAWSLTQMKNCS